MENKLKLINEMAVDNGKIVMLVMDGGRVEFRDATAYWGMDTYDLVDRLAEELGGKNKPSVLAIGQAGENLVAYANIANNKHDFIGRTGMGAVMGSKKLKAIACRGEGEIPIADPLSKERRCRSRGPCGESGVPGARDRSAR